MRRWWGGRGCLGLCLWLWRGGVLLLCRLCVRHWNRDGVRRWGRLMCLLGLLSFLLLLALWRGWRGGLGYLWLLWLWLLCLLRGAGLSPLLLWSGVSLLDRFIAALNEDRNVSHHAGTLAAAAPRWPLLRCLGLLLCLLRRVLLLVLPLRVGWREETKGRLLVPLELWVLLVRILLLLLRVLLLGVLLLLRLLLLARYKRPGHCVELSRQW